jgi:two-component system OmpR family response regulator
MRILIAEDDARLGPGLKKGLETSRYAVDLLTNGEDAFCAASTTPYDLLILDVLMPGMNGFEVCQRLRQEGCPAPILLLTALGEVEDRVKGLDSGADDYLVKPFAFSELEARVRALLRRHSPVKAPVLTFCDITLDTRTHEVRRGQRLLTLGNKEYALLEFFMRHPHQVLSRGMIVEHVWDSDTDHFSNVIDVYVRYLRRKLCQDNEPDVIVTIRGSGYQLKEP